MPLPEATSPARRLISRVGHVVIAVAGRIAFVISWLWGFGSMWFGPLPPEWLRRPVALLFLAGFPVAWYVNRRRRRPVVIAFVVCMVVLLARWPLVRPSADRAWSPGMERTPVVERDGSLVHVRNVRNNVYRSVDDFDVVWEDRTYDLDRLRRVWFVVEPFGPGRFMAHTFLTFEFDDGDALAVSVEIRREAGEKFSAMAAMFRNYELMYVVADERDVIGLRTNHRRSRVFICPLRDRFNVKRELLLEMLARAEKLGREPEFYNTITSTCMINIVRHVDTIAPQSLPLNRAIYLPGFAGEWVYSLGSIETDLPFEEAREHFRVDERAQALDLSDPEFSRRIREGLLPE